MSVSSIEDLTRHAAQLHDAVDWWNDWVVRSLIAAAVAAVAVLVTTRMQLFRAKQLDEVQTQLLKSKESQLAADLKDKDVKIAEANERANQAALELAKFKAPRALSAEQMGQIVAKMKRFAGTEFDGGVGPLNDPEPLHLFDQMSQSLVAAGWRPLAFASQQAMTLSRSNGTPAVGGVSVTNVIIDIHPSQAERLWPVARALAEALAAEGIAAAYDQGSGGGSTNERAIHVLVGRKL
jgi:hypothetical protein